MVYVPGRKQYNILVNVRKCDRLWFVPEFDIASLFGEIDLFNPQPTQPNPNQPSEATLDPTSHI